MFNNLILQTAFCSQNARVCPLLNSIPAETLLNLINLKWQTANREQILKCCITLVI